MINATRAHSIACVPLLSGGAGGRGIGEGIWRRGGNNDCAPLSGASEVPSGHVDMDGT